MHGWAPRIVFDGPTAARRITDARANSMETIMEQAIVGVFASKAEAKAARDALYASGFGPTNVKNAGTDADYDIEEGGISGFFQSLFGTDDHPHVENYSTAAEGGKPVIMVKAQSDAEAARAVSILDSHGAIDVHDQAKESTNGSSKQGAITGSTATKSVNNNQKIPVVEEQWAVGKRKVEQGGVRVYTRESSRPVEETVNLREEHVIVERHPTNRPATQADLNAGKERIIEVRTTREEPVVSKTAKVVEEVEIAKTATERQQTVRDTVRRTDVDVEKLDKSATASLSR